MSDLVERYGLSRATVLKWRRRGSAETVSTRPHRTRATIGAGDAAFLSGWRAAARMPLDDLMHFANALGITITSRSALDRSVRAAGAERLAPEAVRTARRHDPGHVVVTLIRAGSCGPGHADTVLALGCDLASCWLAVAPCHADATGANWLTPIPARFPFRPRSVRLWDGTPVPADWPGTGVLPRAGIADPVAVSAGRQQIEAGVEDFNYRIALATLDGKTPARFLLEQLARRLTPALRTPGRGPAQADPAVIAREGLRAGLTPSEASVRERAMNEAVRMLLLRGVKGLSFNRLAEVVGTSGANLHYHFKTKALLIEQVVSRYAAETADVLSAIWAREDIGFEGKVVATYEFNRWRFIQSNDGETYRRPWSLIARMRMEEEYLNERTRACLRQFSADVSRAIRAGVCHSVAQGELDSDAPVEDIAHQIVAIVNSAGPVTQEARSIKALERLYLGYVAMVRQAYGSRRT